MLTLNVADTGAVRTIQLDRPEALNALNGQMTDDLTDAFRAATEDDGVKVIVLSGAGKAFWAGADLKEMERRVMEEFDELLGPIHTFLETLFWLERKWRDWRRLLRVR